MLDFFVVRNAVSKLCLAAAILPFMLVGCGREASIEIHRIPKAQSGLEELRIPLNQPVQNSDQSPTERMIVGWFEQDNSTWFFKILGPIDQVGKTESEWKAFLNNVEFDNNQPVWELPEGWKAGETRPMRFATLEFGDFDPPLQMAVSSLGGAQDRLLNVNRWRGQMGLAEINSSQLDKHLTKLESSQNSALLFDATGVSTGGRRAPFAGGPFAKTSRDTQPSRPASSPAESGLKFDVPEGWREGRVSSMVPVRLQTNEGEAKAQITVVRMAANVNEWIPNAQRWAKEVGLANLTPQQLEELTRVVEVDGLPGQLLDLTKQESDSEQTTIAGMVKRGETAWFLKLTGDRSIVARSEQEFMDFINSLGFPN